MSNTLVHYNKEQSNAIDHYMQVINIINDLNRFNYGLAKEKACKLKRYLERDLKELKVNTETYSGVNNYESNF
jgi:hypothetical protein